MRGAFLVLVLLATTGCGYARDRMLDLADIGSLKAGVGLGLHAEAHVTEFVRLDTGGYWWGHEWGVTESRGYHAYYLGIDTEAADSFPPAGTYGFPFFIGEHNGQLRSGRGRNDTRLVVPSLKYFYVGPFSLPEGKILRGARSETLHVGGQVDALILSVGAGIDLFEIIDFLAGLATLDPSGDDVPREEEENEDEAAP